MNWLDLMRWGGSALLVFSLMQARVLRFWVLKTIATVRDNHDPRRDGGASGLNKVDGVSSSEIHLAFRSCSKNDLATAFSSVCTEVCISIWSSGCATVRIFLTCEDHVTNACPS